MINHAIVLAEIAAVLDRHRGELRQEYDDNFFAVLLLALRAEVNNHYESQLNGPVIERAVEAAKAAHPWVDDPAQIVIGAVGVHAAVIEINGKYAVCVDQIPGRLQPLWAPYL